MGWGVWAHHMFASGIGPDVGDGLLAVDDVHRRARPGVKILNWLATMYGGRLKFTTAMLFSIGLVGMFTIGGLSGVTHAFAPADTQQTDTYYIVAHFHYVLFGGALLGLFAGMYFWWPKIFGYFLSEKLGKWHFWMMLDRLQPDVRPDAHPGPAGHDAAASTPTTEGHGFDFWNMVATIGAFIIAVSVLIFMRQRGAAAAGTHRATTGRPGPDPWDARSLEWMIPSPTPSTTSTRSPWSHELDEFWHRKYGHDENGRLVRIAETEDVVQKGDATDVHLPSPSYWPLVLAVGLPLVGYGAHLQPVVGRARRACSSSAASTAG